MANGPAPRRTRRCAIYTRKSSEEGLEQAFNSLDAQREACAAYVKSQAHEGWRLLPERFDDGGQSGGTLERPALQRLLEAVRARRLDVIVVYKIDRLTRALVDFAKLAELKGRPAGDYEVGYGKPPEHGRFRKGQSGNPRGRPKGARNKPRPAPEDGLRAIILEEAYRTIQVRDGERIVPLSMAQAVMRSLAVNAAKGHQRAQRLFTSLVAATESESRRSREELYEAAIEYKVQWEKELERRAVLGITAPDPVPHPDHVHIDPRTGAVTFRGPMTKEEKAE